MEDVQKIPYSVPETDADGNPTAPNPGDTCVVTASDTDMGTVVPDATPAAGTIASGFVIGGKKLGTLTITATITKADGTPGPGPYTQALQITPGPATSGSLVLGTPVAQ